MWVLPTAGRFRLREPTDADVSRMAALMREHRDRAVAAADASVVAIAERVPVPTLFSLDVGLQVDRLKTEGIHAVFHDVPLHSSPVGRKLGCAGAPCRSPTTCPPASSACPCTTRLPRKSRGGWSMG